MLGRHSFLQRSWSHITRPDIGVFDLDAGEAETLANLEQTSDRICPIVNKRPNCGSQEEASPLLLKQYCSSFLEFTDIDVFDLEADEANTPLNLDEAADRVCLFAEQTAEVEILRSSQSTSQKVKDAVWLFEDFTPRGLWPLGRVI